jgi:hypothetical protein
MREYGLKNVPRLRSSAVWSDLVADAAFTDIFLTDLLIRRMAAEAVVMSLEPDGDVSARPRKVVARDAALRRTSVPTLVDRMVELHVEALDELRGKRLDLIRIAADVLMADRAHRGGIDVCKLIEVATDAGFVTGIVDLQ